MAAIKCDKCGADIPEGATFCPNCGAPKPEKRTQPKAPVQTPTAQPQASKSIPEVIDSIFSETNMYVMIFLGVLIACIGGITDRPCCHPPILRLCNHAEPDFRILGASSQPNNNTQQPNSNIFCFQTVAPQRDYSAFRKSSRFD